MDNTTQTPNTQQSLSPDALSATLAHATNLQEQMMPKDAPMEAQPAPQTPQNAPQAPQANAVSENDNKAAELKKQKDIESELSQMKTDIELIKKAVIK